MYVYFSVVFSGVKLCFRADYPDHRPSFCFHHQYISKTTLPFRNQSSSRRCHSSGRIPTRISLTPPPRPNLQPTRRGRYTRPLFRSQIQHNPPMPRHLHSTQQSRFGRTQPKHTHILYPKYRTRGRSFLERQKYRSCLGTNKEICPGSTSERSGDFPSRTREIRNDV